MKQWKVLKEEFYSADVVKVAKSLLGKMLIREYGGKTLGGKIVETEAYRGADDPASHAYRGKTRRNYAMWMKPGTAYVYQIYGVHYCLNVVAEPEGKPAAVLIRALEPVLGLEEMMKNRGVKDPKLVASGPARLTQALRITRELNGWDMTRGEVLYIASYEDVASEDIVSTPRIGVKDRRPWRFYIRGNPYVSKARPK
ncbi:MAG: DNA-3-methyladenine glycosylase [Thermoprotei archaeon]|nr:MAG: DNA-3-methyladenine glycosylase [Thermoprotei archaeon]